MNTIHTSSRDIANTTDSTDRHQHPKLVEEARVPSEAPKALDGGAGTQGTQDAERDDKLRALAEACATHATALAGRAWDNLAHVNAFARCASEAMAFVETHGDETSRRAAVHALWPLLPPSARQGRAGRFRALPPTIAARHPDYLLVRGDVPAIAPSWSAFLGVEGAAARIFQSGSGPFLVARGVCPAGAPGAATAVMLEDATRTGWRAHVPTSMWDPDGPMHLELRTGLDGKPLLGADGRAEPIVVTHDNLSAWLFAAGPDARGLDLRSRDDRVLLLVACHLMAERVVFGRSVTAWLEDDNAPVGVRGHVVSACIDAVYEAVAAFTADPSGCRIRLHSQTGDGGWAKRAAECLDATGLFRNVDPRLLTDDGTREIVWLDAFLPPGAASGRLSQVAAGRAFARLATSLLAPLGVLTLSGLKDGSGDVVLQRLLPAEGEDGLSLGTPLLASFGPAGITPLWDAWRNGHGRALPDPRHAPRHDIRQMPGWLAFFLEGINGPRQDSTERPS